MNYTPQVFITDTDPRMDAAIDSQYSSAYSLHCLYHISQNLICNLKALFGNAYNNFLKDFYTCQNILPPTEFDFQWLNLTTTYRKTADYLISELYFSKARWTKTYTTKFFMTGISSTL